jgi:hypothetical protein
VLRPASTRHEKLGRCLPARQLKLIGCDIPHDDACIEGLDIEIYDAIGSFKDKINVWMLCGKAGKPRDQPGRREQRKDFEPEPLTARSASYRRNAAR